MGQEASSGLMAGPPLHPQESARLAALRNLQILDTGPDPIWDKLVDLACQVTGTPTGLVTLVDEQRQWFKAKKNFPGGEGARRDAFCSYTILGPGMMVVEDAAKDERFADNPFVTGEPGIRFYAGVPLHEPGGLPLGALCVIDDEPRTLTEDQQAALRTIAHQAEALIILRQGMLDIERYVAASTTVKETAAENVAAKVRATMTPVMLNLYLLEQTVPDEALRARVAAIRESARRVHEEVGPREPEGKDREEGIRGQAPDVTRSPSR